MADSNLVQLIKRIAVDAVRASKPSDYVTGVVTGTSPLKIKVSQTLELEDDFLLLSRSVTDYETEVSIPESAGWKTMKNDGDGSLGEHKHGIAIEKRKITVHNALEAGEKVLMIRKSGGQKYIVIDRVVNA